MRADRRRCLTGQDGVSLIETLVALGLFAVALGTMGQFMVHQVRSGATNSRYTDAYTLAVQELEDLRMLEYEDMASREKNKTVEGQKYVLTTTVKTGDPGPLMKSIKVKIKWAEPGGEKHVSLQTIYTAVKR